MINLVFQTQISSINVPPYVPLWIYVHFSILIFKWLWNTTLTQKQWSNAKLFKHIYVNFKAMMQV